jgi:hypothetical protein
MLIELAFESIRVSARQQSNRRGVFVFEIPDL